MAYHPLISLPSKDKTRFVTRNDILQTYETTPMSMSTTNGTDVQTAAEAHRPKPARKLPQLGANVIEAIIWPTSVTDLLDHVRLSQTCSVFYRYYETSDFWRQACLSLGFAVPKAGPRRPKGITSFRALAVALCNHERDYRDSQRRLYGEQCSRLLASRVLTDAPQGVRRQNDLHMRWLNEQPCHALRRSNLQAYNCTAELVMIDVLHGDWRYPDNPVLARRADMKWLKEFCKDGQSFSISTSGTGELFEVFITVGETNYLTLSDRLPLKGACRVVERSDQRSLASLCTTAEDRKQMIWQVMADLVSTVDERVKQGRLKDLWTHGETCLESIEPAPSTLQRVLAGVAKRMIQ